MGYSYFHENWWKCLDFLVSGGLMKTCAVIQMCASAVLMLTMHAYTLHTVSHEDIVLKFERTGQNVKTL